MTLQEKFVMGSRNKRNTSTYDQPE